MRPRPFVLWPLFAAVIVLACATGTWGVVVFAVVGFVLTAPPVTLHDERGPLSERSKPIPNAVGHNHPLGTVCGEECPALRNRNRDARGLHESAWDEYRSWERAVVVEYLAGDIDVYHLESELEFYGADYLTKTTPVKMRMKRRRRP